MYVFLCFTHARSCVRESVCTRALSRSAVASTLCTWTQRTTSSATRPASWRPTPIVRKNEIYEQLSCCQLERRSFVSMQSQGSDSDCVSDIANQLDLGQRNCSCNIDCEETDFQLSTSESVWPSIQYAVSKLFESFHQ